MNNSAKMIKGIVAIIVATLTILSMSSFVFASDHTVTSVNDVEKIIETINAEYGTNIHILSKDELDSLGISEDEEYSVENVDLEKFETELRNIVEVDFPHFERNTQEALAKRMLNAETSDTREDSGDYRNNPIIARKAISYAEAGVQAYITTNNQGVINWSTVVDTYCYTDVHQMIWFYAPSITYSRIDAILMHGIRSLDRFQAHRKHMVIFNVLTSSRGGKQAIILKYNKSKQREGNTVSLPKEF